MTRGRLLVLALFATPTLLLGALWTAENLGSVPTYKDTRQYLRLARELKVDRYRGIAYPGLLAAVDRMHPGATILRPRAQGQSWVQLAQIFLSVLGLTYFAAVLMSLRRRESERSAWSSRLWLVLWVLLMALDPLVSHFGLSLMPDALALSASLVFCAAFTSLLTKPSKIWIPIVLLAVSYLVLANTRAEKNLVLLATGVTTIAASWWLRRASGGTRGASRSRLLIAGAVVSLGFAATLAVQQATYRPQGRMPMGEWLLHHRIIYPHLTEVYDKLPDQLKERIPPRKARRYDRKITGPRRVLKTISGNSEDRKQMAHELAAIVVRERWPTIAFDIGRDSVENVFATLSFYYRLGVLAVGGEELSQRWFRSGGSRYTYTKLSEEKPGLSLAYVVSAALLLLASIVASVVVLRRRGLELRRNLPGGLEPWLPVASFCLFNALAFSLTADLVHIRYTLLAHTVFTGLAIRGFLEWASPARPAGDCCSVEITGQSR